MRAAAARANADWCDAFSRSHETAGSFDDACWWSPVRTPPLYPDAVTLAPGLDAGTLLARVDAGPGRPELLANPAVRILARFDGGEVRAGAIANGSAGAVGLSDVFETGARPRMRLA